jgi:hypothetical protein
MEWLGQLKMWFQTVDKQVRRNVRNCICGNASAKALTRPFSAPLRSVRQFRPGSICAVRDVYRLGSTE